MTLSVPKRSILHSNYVLVLGLSPVAEISEQGGKQNVGQGEGGGEEPLFGITALVVGTAEIPGDVAEDGGQGEAVGEVDQVEDAKQGQGNKMSS